MGSTPISTEKIEVQGLRSHAQLYPNSDQAETQTQGFFSPQGPAISSEMSLGLPGKQAGGPPSAFGSLLSYPTIHVSRSQANASLKGQQRGGFFSFLTLASFLVMTILVYIL